MLLITFLLLSVPSIRVPDLANATEAAVVKQLGPKHIEKRLPFTLFYPKGFAEVRVNDFGPKMNVIQVTFLTAESWAQVVKQLGIQPDGSRTVVDLPTQLPILRRNGFTFARVRNMPSKKAPWKLSYEEIAVQNPARTRTLRDQIRAAKGPERIRLIQQCYDWRSQVTFSTA